MPVPFMRLDEIRSAFLHYFVSKAHRQVDSSPLVPGNDPSLLFTNAGMVQFKDCFLGTESRPYTRATSSQICLRAGGKHNDLDNVGYTARHHTFFEMLGNFSFGDYFKKEAIHYAWEFLTGVLKLPPEKLWITVFESDTEAEAIWLNEIGVSPQRLSRCSEKDNFWAMGETGPCGPCTEIYYDHGEAIPGGVPGSDDEGDRYVEIWNLVFMEFNRNEKGELQPLPKKSVDTGMGLERIAAVMQGVLSNYETDIFQTLIQAAAKAVGTRNLKAQGLRVLADHIRSVSFLIAEGVLPGNEGRAYVLRRILRRAIRYGYQLGQKQPFFYQMVPALVSVMGETYPILSTKATEIARVIQQEEKQFSRTLEQGLALLHNQLNTLKSPIFPGELAFKLYDTYGFPLDLTQSILRDKQLSVDLAAFNLAMSQQKDRARKASQFQSQQYDRTTLPFPATQFIGYDSVDAKVTLLGILDTETGMLCEQAQDKQTSLALILDKTPFYAEAGGQVGDKGQILAIDGSVEFEVQDTQILGNHTLHIGKLVGGELKPGLSLQAQVWSEARRAIAQHHSATHLLHAALRQVLGENLVQKGSLVSAERLRFDFAHQSALSESDIRSVELLVNREIQANTPVKTAVLPVEVAQKQGALALFGEKYGETVRVLSMGKANFSMELCGGTHVQRTGDIGAFKILFESSVASGIRRIEAVAGMAVIQLQQEAEILLSDLSKQLKVQRGVLQEKVTEIVRQLKEKDKMVQRWQQRYLSQKWVQCLAEQVGQAWIIERLSDLEPNQLREASLGLLKQSKAKGVFLVLTQGTMLTLGSATKAEASPWHAQAIANHLKVAVPVKGGGSPQYAQLSASTPADATAVVEWVLKLIDDLKKA